MRTRSVLLAVSAVWLVPGIHAQAQDPPGFRVLIIYSSEGRFDASEDALSRALHIHTEALGRENHLVAEDLLGLGRAVRGQGRLGEARRYFQESIAIWGQVAPGHPLRAEAEAALRELPD